jgi:hypothetical protein
MARQTCATSLVLCTVVFASACSRGEETKTVTPEVQTQRSQAGNMPMTIAGCVKAGDAADTYVLTAARAEGSADSATYQLVGAQTANLREQIGRRVEVSGTLEAQQEIAAQATAQAKPKDDERPTGTAGTPTVQTKTEIDIKRLSVASIKPLGDKCDM